MRLSLAVIGLLICILIGSAQATIRATTILFRHGERTPAYKVAAMPSALAEDIGYGQLTQVSDTISGTKNFLTHSSSSPVAVRKLATLREWTVPPCPLLALISQRRLLPVEQHANHE